MGKRFRILLNFADNLETLLDLLDLYNRYRRETVTGPEFIASKFIAVQIDLNHQAQQLSLPSIHPSRGKKTKKGQERCSEIKLETQRQW